MERKYRRNPDFVLREVAGEYILIPTGAAAAQLNGLASLNETGAFLWKLLERERTVEELSGLLTGEYELTEEQGAADAADFLRLAAERNLVLQC